MVSLSVDMAFVGPLVCLLLTWHVGRCTDRRRAAGTGHQWNVRRKTTPSTRQWPSVRPELAGRRTTPRRRRVPRVRNVQRDLVEQAGRSAAHCTPVQRCHRSPEPTSSCWSTNASTVETIRLASVRWPVDHPWRARWSVYRLSCRWTWPSALSGCHWRVSRSSTCCRRQQLPLSLHTSVAHSQQHCLHD